MERGRGRHPIDCLGHLLNSKNSTKHKHVFQLRFKKQKTLKSLHEPSRYQKGCTIWRKKLDCRDNFDCICNVFHEIGRIGHFLNMYMQGGSLPNVHVMLKRSTCAFSQVLGFRVYLCSFPVFIKHVCFKTVVQYH